MRYVYSLAGVSLVLLAATAAQASFVAYNDFGGTESGYDGGYVTAFTGSAGGGLIDYDTGESVGVSMSLSAAIDPGGGALTEGTPAYDYFHGCVNVDGYMYHDYRHPYTITFTGLDPNKTYDVVLFGDEGVAGLETMNVYQILSADSFDNESSGTISGDNNEIATMNVGYNTLTGYVAHYTNIRPGADGDFIIRIRAASEDGIWCLNALRLSTPEPSSLALLGIGGMVLLRRRRFAS